MNKELLFFINKIGYIKLTQLLVVILVYTFFELITIGSIFPLIKVVISPDWIKSIHLPLLTALPSTICPSVPIFFPSRLQSALSILQLPSLHMQYKI